MDIKELLRRRDDRVILTHALLDTRLTGYPAPLLIWSDLTRASGARDNRKAA